MYTVNHFSNYFPFPSITKIPHNVCVDFIGIDRKRSSLCSLYN